jgi:hypothetical protein
MHQVIGTGLIFVTAPMPFVLMMDLLKPFGRTIPHSFELLSETPFFPIQMALALFLGWSLGGFLQHRSMLWVWIGPALILGYVFLQFPARPVFLAEHAYLFSDSAFSHFFGRGCQLRNYCVDQVYLTLPFCSSVAYSFGAWLAQKLSRPPTFAVVMSEVRVPRASIVGLGTVCYHLAVNRQLLEYNNILHGCFGVRGFFWRLVLLFAFTTYCLMVVVSLVGPRFSMTRWFLSRSPLAGVEEERVA